MARISTKPEIVIQRLRARLISQISGANESTLTICSDPDMLPEQPVGEFHFVISPSPRFQFDQGLFDGGEQNQCETTWIIAVTVHTIHPSLDQPFSDEMFFYHPDSGVMPVFTRVLNALAGHDLKDEQGNEILAQPLFPYDGDLSKQSARRGSMQLGLAATFDWDLVSSIE